MEKPLTQREAYYLAVGRLANAMARTESLLHMNFHHFSKIPPEIGNILKQQTRANRLISWIRQLMAAHAFSQPARAEFEVLAAQFSEIDAFRDRLLHRGGKLEADGSYSTDNLPTAKEIEAVERRSFTIDDLHAAATDMERIGVRLADLADPAHINPDPAVQAVLRAPWQYKPPALQQKKARNGAPGPQARQPSSRM